MAHYNRELIIVLDRIWKKTPELRLGQLIENVTVKDSSSGCCIYYLQDDVFLKKLLKFEKMVDKSRNVG